MIFCETLKEARALVRDGVGETYRKCGGGYCVMHFDEARTWDKQK